MRLLLLAIAFLFLSGCTATVYTEPEPVIYRPYYAPPVYYYPAPVFIYSRGRCR